MTEEMTDREKALEAVHAMEDQLVQMAIRYEGEECLRHGIPPWISEHAETIRAALSQEPIADKPTPFLLMERIKDDLWAVEQLLAMREKANEEAWMTIDRMNEEVRINTQIMAEVFCGWELPKTVCSDLCVTNPHYEHTRRGTNLLTVAEAKQFFDYLAASYPHLFKGV